MLDAENATHPPFYDECRGYVMLVFPELTIEADGFSFTSTPISAYVSSEGLATIRSGTSKSIESTKVAFSSGHHNTPKTPFGLLLRILTHAADQFLEILPSARSDLDAFQLRMLDPSDTVKDWTCIYERRSAYRKLRSLSQQFEEAMANWRDDTEMEFDERLLSRFNNLLEHLRRASNQLRECESEVDSLVELQFAATAHQTNETVRILTVLSSNFLPLTFLAGIFGMNFAYMPELQMRYGYPVALDVMLALALVLAALFKKKGWF